MKVEEINPIVRLQDDHVFGEVMAQEDICLMFLQEVVPELNIKKIVNVHAQEKVKLKRKERGGVFDIYAEDANGRRFDIEMQVLPQHYLIKRANFYLSLLDFVNRPAGKGSYEQINDVISIFVCMFDPFDQDQRMYSFRMYDPKLKMELDPNRRLIFLNSKGKHGKISPGLTAYLQAVNGQVDGQTPLVNRIRQQLVDISNDPEEARYIMREDERRQMYKEYYKEEGLKEGRTKGLAEGHAEGLAEGRAKGHEEGLAKGKEEERSKNIKSFIKFSKAQQMTFDQIMSGLTQMYGDSISKEDLEKIVAQVK